MKKLIPQLLIAAAVLACALPSFSQDQKKKEGAAKKQQVAGPGKRTSPHETVFARIGESRSLVSISYGRPYSQLGGKADKEKRKIWGTLVPWDKAWRLGSDEATTISLQHPIEIGGKTIPAGVHAIYMVPSESGASKLAFSTNVVKWGIPVDESKDIARVDLKKESLSTPVDQLTISVENAPPEGGVIKVMWENRVALRASARIRDSGATVPPFTPRPTFHLTDAGTAAAAFRAGAAR
jgi:hypothetical protein